MTKINFYHLQKKTVNEALPEILNKALERNLRIIIKVDSKDEVADIDKNLWTYSDESFIPHGCKKNGMAEDQPIWITDKDENPNNATMLAIIDSAESSLIDSMEICCEIFDGNNDEVVAKSRTRWKEYKERNFELAYFQQDEQGKWQKKA